MSEIRTNAHEEAVAPGRDHSRRSVLDHAAYFRLQIEETAVDGMDYIRLDADGKIAEVTIFWRPLPAGVQMQGHLADGLGMQPWELRTNGG